MAQGRLLPKAKLINYYKVQFSAEARACLSLSFLDSESKYKGSNFFNVQKKVNSTNFIIRN